MERGKIILARFPFSDYTSFKRRPAIVLSNSKYTSKDFILGFISSKISDTFSATDFVLDINDQDFEDTGLLKTSIFKMSKIVTLNKKLIVGELGYVSERIMRELEDRLKLVFGLP